MMHARTEGEMTMFWDTTIKEGDTVMVVRDCCGKYVGRVFKVGYMNFVAHPSWIDCGICKKAYANVPYAEVVPGREGDFVHAPMNWLKKLPPVTEHESEKRDEEITA